MDDFSPSAIVRDWPKGQRFTIADAVTGAACFGGTGSGKTSGVAKHLAIGYMEAGFGGLVLCSKVEERRQWVKWAKEAGRSDDLVIFDASGKHRFDFLQWEAGRAGEGGGLVINIVHLLSEIATAVAKASGTDGGSGGDGKFFEDALNLMLTELVGLAALSGEPVTLPRLRELAASAPRRMADLENAAWREQSACARLLAELAEKEPREDAEKRGDLAEVFSYWTADFPMLSDRTRSIVDMMFSMMVQPFLFRPLRRLFTSGSTITPEATFDGKIIVVDLPVQEFRLAGRVAGLAWKHCFQIAVMRRFQPDRGYLRPVFLWSDECQNYVTAFDAEYQAVARSAAGATVYLTQNRESLKRVLGSDATVDALLGNLATKFFCQNSSTDTNEWASTLLGERWIDISTLGVSQHLGGMGPAGAGNHVQGSSSRTPQKRAYIEPAAFAQLKRGGAAYENRVTAIVYKGGQLFEGEGAERVPYTLLSFTQNK
jgi:hypothetical protein